MKPNLRLTAALVIDKVTNGTSLADCLEPALATLTEHRDRAFVQALCYGVCRYYTQLDVLLSLLLKKPMNAKDSDVHALLCIGLYQLMDMRVAEHAAVSETVEAVNGLKKQWARGLVNAILREYLRSKEKLQKKMQQDIEARYAHPMWWVKMLKAAWPNEWKAILTANNEHPPMSLRVNLLKTTREAYLENLKKLQIDAQPIPATPSGISLANPLPVEEIPGFNEGVVHVQDGASQLAAGLMKLEPNQHVLDACAAPGGKLAHLLETEPNITRVIAVEKDPERIKLIPQDAKTQLHLADAANIQTYWDNQAFDRILLDAPCSASGIVRRHPDIKLLRMDSDIKKCAKEQYRILNALWPTLKPGGFLLYATCSIFPQENTEVIQSFLKSHADAKEDKITESWGIECLAGRQILPGMQGMDGFFYARLVKVTSGS